MSQKVQPHRGRRCPGQVCLPGACPAARRRSRELVQALGPEPWRWAGVKEGWTSQVRVPVRPQELALLLPGAGLFWLLKAVSSLFSQANKKAGLGHMCCLGTISGLTRRPWSPATLDQFICEVDCGSPGVSAAEWT